WGGKVVAYSGDTEWTDALADAARDADLFVCEAYFFEKRVPHHLDYRTLVDRRESLGCRRLVLTHMSADMLGRLPLAGVEAAEDGGGHARGDLGDGAAGGRDRGRGGHGRPGDPGLGRSEPARTVAPGYHQHDRPPRCVPRAGRGHQRRHHGHRGEGRGPRRGP